MAQTAVLGISVSLRRVFVCLCSTQNVKRALNVLVFCTDLKRLTKGGELGVVSTGMVTPSERLAVACEISPVSHLFSPYPQHLSHSAWKCSSIPWGQAGGVKLWQMFLP